MKTYSRYFLGNRETVTCDGVVIASRKEGEMNNADYDIAVDIAMAEVVSGTAEEDEELPLSN